MSCAAATCATGTCVMSPILVFTLIVLLAICFENDADQFVIDPLIKRLIVILLLMLLCTCGFFLLLGVCIGSICIQKFK